MYFNKNKIKDRGYDIWQEKEKNAIYEISG